MIALVLEIDLALWGMIFCETKSFGLF